LHTRWRWISILDQGRGIEATIDKKVGDAKIDINQALAPINLAVQDLKNGLAKQAEFNKAISDQMDALTKAANRPAVLTPPPNITAKSTAFAANGNYSILIFYKDQRRQDAVSLTSRLTASGFQASAINSTLEEVRIEQQPDGSTFLIPTAKGQTVIDDVAGITKAVVPNSKVTVGNAYQLRRGDVQIYMF
jgi:hypothetical protein